MGKHKLPSREKHGSSAAGKKGGGCISGLGMGI